MRITATGPGKRGTLDQGVGKLELSQATGYEAKLLLILYDAIHRDSLSFWAAVMWAVQNNELTLEEKRAFHKLAKRSIRRFVKSCDGTRRGK